VSAASVVIVASGAAGTAAATQMRKLGFGGDLTLVHGEGPVPYNRSTVNKTLLQADARLDSVRTALPNDPPKSLLNGRGERLATQRRTVVLEDGNQLSYDAVLIATDARPRVLPGVCRVSTPPKSATASRPYAPMTTPNASRRVLATIGSKARASRTGRHRWREPARFRDRRRLEGLGL